MKTLLAVDFLGSVPQILSYGASGLCVILFYMAFQLIKNEQKRHGEPRKSILKMITYFMIINLANIIFVGIVGIPTISKNSALASTNDDLTSDKTKLLSEKKQLTTEKMQLVSDTLLKSMKESSDSISKVATNKGIKKHAKNINQYAKSTLASIDALSKNTKVLQPGIKDSTKFYKDEIQKAWALFQKDTNNSVYREELLNKVQENTTKIADYHQKNFKNL